MPPENRGFDNRHASDRDTADEIIYLALLAVIDTFEDYFKVGLKSAWTETTILTPLLVDFKPR